MKYYEEGKIIVVNDKSVHKKNRIEIQPITAENIDKIFRSFKNWQNLSIEELRSFMKNDKYGKSLIRSKTRTKLEKHLPWAFVILWIILSVMMIIKKLI